MSRWKNFGQFVVVGVMATALHYAILFVLVEHFGVAATLASAIGYVCSTFVNYALNRRITFASDRPHSEALPRFLAVAFTGLSINALVFWLMHGFLGLHILPAQMLATGVVLLWNYLMNLRWIFSSGRSG